MTPVSDTVVAPPRPAKADELTNAGVRLFHEGKLDPARLHFLTALALEPKNPIALQNLSAVLRNMSHFQAAIAVAKRCVALTEERNPYQLTNLGVSLLGVKDFKNSLALIREACDLLPDSYHSWQNLGLVYFNLGFYDKALACFERGIAIQPNNLCKADKSITLLSMGRIQEGLALYECRWEMLYRSPVWNLPFPEWQGEDLTNRRIILHHEQGFGDSIMLSRFVKNFVERNCYVSLAVPEQLVRLFRKNFKNADVVPFGHKSLSEDSSYDYHSPLLSVMRHLGIQGPSDIDAKPYLTAPLGPPPAKLPKAAKRIGICWASGNHGPVLRDRRRMVPLPLFLPLFDDLDVALISLQVGDDAKDIPAYGLEGLVFDISYKLEDFAATASLIAPLDLVISVDSAVCHLAGAMGKPVIMLSPFTRCWRWWNIPSGGPWYNTMTIFSQSENGTWDEAMKLAVARARGILNEKVYAVG